MRRLFLFIGLCLLAIGFTPQHATRAATITAPVTLYLHGHRGNARSLLPLMQAGQRSAGATPALVATVAPDGRVTFAGRLTASTPRPQVQVVFADNDTVDYRRLRQWLYNVTAALAQRYGVRTINLVAHSLGNTAVEWYLLRWGNDPHLPRVARWAAIAGPFDSIPRMHLQPRRNHLEPDGRPHFIAPDFRRAMYSRDRFPHIAVLNLYGDLADGSHSDGRILNASSRALGFLVAGRAASYRELRFTGPDASHHNLRFNPRVASAVDHFLWR